MISKKKLLKILIENKEFFKTGLCAYTHYLVELKIITDQEEKYINSLHKDVEETDASYKWERGNWEVREDWLIANLISNKKRLGLLLLEELTNSNKRDCTRNTLCFSACDLLSKNKILQEEFIYIKLLINKHRTKRASVFYWSRDDMQSRIDWIHIHMTGEIRTQKKLLKVFKHNKDYFKTGLCSWLASLLESKLITKAESEYINVKIRKERQNNTGYYWTRANISPRLKWLKKNLPKKL